MTIKDDFIQAAAEIFETFDSLIIDAVYVRKQSSYTPGGNAPQTELTYPIRLIRDEKVTRSTLSLTNDLPAVLGKYMYLTNTVPVVVEEKDFIRIDGSEYTILVKDSDPADAVTVILVGMP